MNYRPEWFELHELVPPEILQARGDSAWEMLDPGALVTLDALRTHFGSVTVNDWTWGGQYRESGLRTPDTATGAKWSMHKYGRAFDCKFEHATPQAVYEHILAQPEQFPHITTLEHIDATPTWVHFDTRNNRGPGIRIVRP